ncbi:MAG: MBL fold metallo-hydrolase [bacterium]|nr:MBL fold metallo-hydrolase [bacterium]
MKTVISIAKCLLLIVLVVGFVVLGSKTVRNKIFYSSGLTPKEVFTLSDKINSSSPEDTSEKRTELLKEIDAFAKGSVSGNGFSSNIYSLIRVRLDQALREIPQTPVPKGKVRIWYIYNMGVIAKSEDKTIAFDLDGTHVYSAMADFAKYIDVLVITHFHNDHFDLPVVKEALKNGATVIIPGDKTVFKGNDLVRDAKGEDAVSLLKRRSAIDSDNFISLQPQEKTIITGVEITAYPAKHIHNPDEEDSFMDTPLNWYLVNLAGLQILHMGDGTSFDYQPDFTNKNIDVFITHSTALDPRTKEDLIKLVPNTKTILPLHVLELGHGANIVNEKHDWYMNYQSILDNYLNGYHKALQGKTRFIPLIWGESLLF